MFDYFKTQKGELKMTKLYSILFLALIGASTTDSVFGRPAMARIENRDPKVYTDPSAEEPTSAPLLATSASLSPSPPPSSLSL
jgi:hypothetical protein